MKLLSHFEQQINQYYPNQRHYLIAFSGGLDSTALLLLFAQLREKYPHLQLRAIHIHHGLSINADAWARHCEGICLQLSIPFVLEKVQIDTKKGIEAGAREARYKRIERCLYSDEVLVTAHHQQDQIETFLLALKRGSGVTGLGAMPICGQLYGVRVFRPLLSMTRQMLLDYVQQQRLPWIEDESNVDNRYERNFLRNEILPRLRTRWAHFDSAVQRSAQHCFEQQQLLNELLQESFITHVDAKEKSFQLEDFEQYSSLKQRALLRLWLDSLSLPMPSTLQLNQLLQDVVYARQDSNPQFQLGEKMLRRYKNKLYLTPHFLDLSSIKLNVNLNEPIYLPDNLGILLISEQEHKLLALWNKGAEQISWSLPLTNQQIHIAFHYSGKARLTNQSVNEDMKKLWQKFNVPVWQRQRTPLIFYGEKFQCALGYFNAVTEV